ncbi:MAG TPA: hypothetical protein VFL69_08140 [Marmoricola sp.]|nr:hypothetical protein [Marmoricola sp.]
MSSSKRRVLRNTPGAHRVWSLCARTTVGLGLLCLLVLWPNPWLLLVEAALVTMRAVAALAPRRRTLKALRPAGSVALALLGAVGLIALLGWAGTFMVALVGLGGILLGREPRHRPGRRDHRPAGGRPGATARPEPRPSTVPAADRTDGLRELGLPGADTLPDITDSDLCHAWRRSFVELQTSRSVTRRMRVVQLRQLYLDELDRRHPKQLRTWFASGARAAGNPLPYLGRPAGPPSS